MEKEYAMTLSRSLADGVDEAKLVEGLVAHLKSEGRLKLLPSILKELKALDAKQAKQAPFLEVASEAEVAAALASAKQAGMHVTEAVVNSSLIKGWRAREAGTLVDRSAKQALVDLYQKITN